MRIKDYMVCPKCNSRLEKKTFVYTGFFNYFDKVDVTGKTNAEIRSRTASGVVSKPKNKSINECLASTAGIGYLEKRLVCNKCDYSQET